MTSTVRPTGEHAMNKPRMRATALLLIRYMIKNEIRRQGGKISSFKGTEITEACNKIYGPEQIKWFRQARLWLLANEEV